MNAVQFSHALGKVNDKYIMEAITYTYGDNATKYRSRKWIIIAAIVAALLLVGFTVIPMIVKMANGSSVEWDDSHLFVSGVADNMAEVREGRVYFTLDNSDITEYCSATTYFRYDFVDEQDIAHVILVGGEIDSIGWTEIIFFEGGKRLSHSALQTQDGNDPIWYVMGNDEVNKDYGYVEPARNTEHREEYSIDVDTPNG